MQTYSLELTNAYQRFQQDGFICLKRVLSPKVCQQLTKIIHQQLANLPLMHNSSPATYFAAVNRWPAYQLLGNAVLLELIEHLQPTLCEILQLPLTPYEIDIIYKSPYTKQATPCHQDIAYTFNRPYYASTWLALSDVTLADSPLQFLPKSHHLPIQPAIDFWQPDFIDEFRQSTRWRENAKLTLTACGDAWLFSSKIWHASLPHHSAQTRLAIVIRWGNETLDYGRIPQPRSVPFGMWSCGPYTEKLLNKGYQLIANEKFNELVVLIKAWQLLIQQSELPFIRIQTQCINALEKLRILHEAYLQYQGGDGQGIVYAQLWHCMLKYLKDYLG